jgi:hypothetical protein|tara:strand:- start:416 stop:769 length:354 start_codon:yes stop_codon:yes gene_type:complete
MAESKQIVRSIEKAYPEMMERFEAITGEQYELFCRKQYDYGCANITLGGDLNDDEDRMFALTALVIRMNDKVNRLKNIIVKHRGENAVRDETYMDAFKDLSVYGVIAQLVAEKVWGK